MRIKGESMGIKRKYMSIKKSVCVYLEYTTKQRKKSQSGNASEL